MSDVPTQDEPPAHGRPATTVPVAGLIAAGVVPALGVGRVGRERRGVQGRLLLRARATAGRRPWAVYAAGLDCNYPPVIPYWLTAVAAVVRAAHAPPLGRLAVELVKLPNVLAWAAGAVACDRGLRSAFGPRAARAAAVAYAACLPVAFNAAVWGQWEAVVSLAMVGAVVALLDGRPLTSAVALGLGLATKAQAVVVAPALAVYAYRRFGPAAVARAATVTLAVVLAAAAPDVAGGAGRAVRRSYTGAAGFFPLLSLDAYNGWELLYEYRVHVRGQPAHAAAIDSRPWVGPVTPKRVGLTALAGYTAWLMLGLYRRPTPDTFVAAAALTALAFYALPTEVHERYGVPAAALLAVLAGRAFGWGPFVAVGAITLVNQAVAMVVQEAIYSAHGPAPYPLRRAADVVAVVGSVAALAAFAWVTVRYHRLARATA